MNKTRSHAHVAVLRAVLASALLTLAAIAVCVLPAHAVDDGSLGIRPADEADFFHISLRPGESIDATAIVSNHTTTAVTLLNYPVDAVSDPTGAFAMADQDTERVGVGAWVELESGEVQVPPGSEVPVEFRLTVPANAPPGDYAGALIIQSPPVPGETTIVDGVAVRLDVVQRQGVRIYLEVEGTAVQSLAVGTLNWSEDNGALTFTLNLHNTGNTVLHPEATLHLDGWIGDPAELHFEVPKTLLPGAQVEVTAYLADAATLRIGEARATVNSEAGQENVTASVIYGPWLLLLLGALLTAAAAYGALRLISFLKKAQRALAKAGVEGMRLGPLHRSNGSATTRTQTATTETQNDTERSYPRRKDLRLSNGTSVTNP